MPIRTPDLANTFVDDNGVRDFIDDNGVTAFITDDGSVVIQPPPPPPDPIPVPVPPPPDPIPVPVPPPPPPPPPAPVYRWEKYKSGGSTLYRIHEGATKRVDALSLTEARWLCGVLKITPP